MSNICRELARDHGPFQHMILPPEAFHRLLREPGISRLDQQTAFRAGTLYYSPGYNYDFEFRLLREDAKTRAERMARDIARKTTDQTLGVGRELQARDEVAAMLFIMWVAALMVVAALRWWTA